MNLKYLYRSIRFLIVIGAVVLALYSFYFLSKVTYPFLIGLIIAFIINPLVDILEKRARMPRLLAVFIALIIIFALFAGLITLLIAEIVSGANYLSTVVPNHLDTLIEYIEKYFTAQILPIYEQLTSVFNKLESGQQDTIIGNIQNVGNQDWHNCWNLYPESIWYYSKYHRLASKCSNRVNFFLIGYFFYQQRLVPFIEIGGKLLPEKAKTSSRSVFIDLKKALFGFIKAQLTLISITTVIILIGLLILRVDYAITIALVTGIVDIIPYLGTGAVFVPWIIYAAIGGDTGLALGLGVLYIIVLVQRQVMEPKILSSNIGLDPLATLIALFVGFKLIGFLGLIVGPVTLVIISTLYRANVFYDLWVFIKGNEV